jgi:hypothetical protein
VFDLSTLRENLNDCDKPLRQRILSKFFRLEAARHVSRINDANKLDRMSRAQIERYRRKMMGDTSPVPSDDDNITVADDVNYGLGGRSVVALVLAVTVGLASMGVLGFAIGSRDDAPPVESVDTDTINTIRFEE